MLEKQFVPLGNALVVCCKADLDFKAYFIKFENFADQPYVPVRKEIRINHQNETNNEFALYWACKNSNLETVEIIIAENKWPKE